MFKKVDLLGVFGAAMMVGGLVCFLTSQYETSWAAYLGGPLLWFFGLVFAIVWMVLHFYNKTVSSPESSTPPAPERTNDNAGKNIRAALFLFAGILSASLFIVPAESADTSAGADLFKSRCAMCHGPDGTGKTPMGQKFSIPDLHSADVQKKSAEEIGGIIAKGKNKMPAYEGKLTPEQISQISAFIKTLSAQH